MLQQLLGTILGLLFVFYIAALAGSAFVESIGNLLRKRPKYLLRGLLQLLESATGTTQRPAPWQDTTAERQLYRSALNGSDEGVSVAALMNSPLIRPFKQIRAGGTATRLPSSLPPAVFAEALVAQLTADPGQDGSSPDLKAAIDRLPNDSLRKALQTLFATAEGDLASFKGSVAAWYAETMTQVLAAYRRWAKRWIIVFGLAAALFFHLDALALTSYLWNNAPARVAVVQAASTRLESSDPSPTAASAAVAGSTTHPQDAAGTDACTGQASFGQACVQELADARLPVGPQSWQAAWPAATSGGLAFLSMVLGILITTAATVVGAPFWFDLLSRLGSLRNEPSSARSTGAA